VKFIRCSKNDTAFHGILENDRILKIEGDLFSDYTINENEIYQYNDVTVLSPVLPSKIIAVGLNYRDHAQELHQAIPDEPVLFMKPSTSVIGHNENIIYPPCSHRVDYEAEIAAVVKKTAYMVNEKDAGDYILGYTCLNDVTARDHQQKDGQWTRSKSFNTFCPIGPVIENDINPDNVDIFARLNGEIRQSSNTSNFIVPIFRLFSFISHVMTLLPGDIITTGTPSGIGVMKPGDTIEIEVEGIGILKNRVVASEL